MSTLSERIDMRIAICQKFKLEKAYNQKETLKDPHVGKGLQLQKEL